jgi:hypothetical protein
MWTDDVSAFIEFRVDHSICELFGISQESLLFQCVNQILLLMQMLCALLEIFLLLEDTISRRNEKRVWGDKRTSFSILADAFPCEQSALQRGEG